jgi:hypothetical protein
MATSKTSILLTADDKTRAAFDSARRGLQGLESVAGRLNGLLATLGAGAIAGGGLLAFAKSGIDAADALNDMSQKLGISVEQLGGYKLAAEQSGITLEDMARSSRQLAKAIAENDPLLARLGVTSRDVDGAMLQLADAFAAMPDGAEKTALSMRLMGKSGADMIPMLNGGREALRGMLEDGKALYGVTAEMAKAADQFNDEMAKLKIASEGFAVKIGGVLLPALNEMFEDMRNGIDIFGSFQDALLGIGLGIDPFDSVTEGLAKYRAEVKRLKELQGASQPEFAALLDPQIKTAEQKLEWYKRLQQREALARNDLFGTKDYKKASTPMPELSGLLTEDDAAKLQQTLAKAFDTKFLDDFLAKFGDTRRKLSAEYDKLTADLTGTTPGAGSSLGDFQVATGTARRNLADGNLAGAQAQIDAAKGTLKTLKDSGEIGWESGAYVAQLRELEMAMLDMQETTAQKTVSTMRSNLDLAAQEIAAMEPVHVPLAAEAIANDLRATFDTVRRELEANPIRVPVQLIQPGGSTGGDIRDAAQKRGGR